MTIEEVLQHDLKFRYMLLGRLQADCEYYLGFGNKSSRRLWAGSEKTQIEYMTKIHDSFQYSSNGKNGSLVSCCNGKGRNAIPVAPWRYRSRGW